MVPDNVINGFARVLGVDITDENGMDVDGKGRAKGFDTVRDKVKELMREGYSASQLLSQVRLETFTSFISLT